MIDVSTVQDRAGLDELREPWERLFSRTADASFAQTFEGYRAALDASGGEPRVFVATAAGRMLGLWPLLLTTRRTAFGRRRVLADGATGGTTAGPLGPHPAATATVIARHLRRSDGWDTLSAGESRGAKGEPGHVSSALAAAGLTPHLRASVPLVTVELAGRWADVLAGLDERARLAVYRTHHYADAEDGVAFERARPSGSSAAPDAFREALSLAASVSAAERRRLGVLFAEAFRLGAGDVALLRRDGRPVAAALSLVSPGGLENRFVAVARDAPPLADVRLLCEMFRDGLSRGDGRITFAAAPGHPAAGWARSAARRAVVEADAAGRVAVRLGRLGTRLRDAFRFSSVAAGA